MKALAYAFSAENPHALRNILLVAVTIAYLVVIVVLFLRLRHANQKNGGSDERTQQTKNKQNRLPKKQKLLHRKNRLRANYILAVHAQKKHILIRKCRSMISALEGQAEV